jgi:cbb3-type cytochrome oxidase subunit 3
MFCFIVLGIYFLLVVYSLYRELKGTAPPNHA